MKTKISTAVSNITLSGIREMFKLASTYDDVIVTTGGIGGITSFFRTVLDPGDQVLVPEPYFPPYQHHIEWLGGTG